MNNKLLAVILVLLVVIAGGAAYYSYTLNQRIDGLDKALSDYRTEEAGRIAGVSDNLARLGAETGDRLDTLDTQLAETNDNVASLSGGLAAAEKSISDVETGLSGQIEDLAGRLAAAEGEMAATTFDARAVYDKVSPATVLVTNADMTIFGSGFIYDDAGHVVTAYHVIEGLSPIVVVTDDGRLFNAVVTGSSQYSDVAVLELDRDPGVTPPAMADSSRLRIGEPVAAIGSPLDIRDMLTAGVTSQLNRSVNYGVDNLWIPNLLQFDAPVNPGNSGGPLANGAGEIIGIVVARIEATEGAGINYAVASNKVKRVADALIANGSFPYPWIGVNIADFTPGEARANGLETTNGIGVGGVDASGPAQAAGIRTGDIIVAIDGTQVRNTDELTSYLGENLSPGDQAVIEVLRGGVQLELTVRIGTR